MTSDVLRYWNTLRYLKPTQITNRVRRRLFPPRPATAPAPEIRMPTGNWHGCPSEAAADGNRCTFLHRTAEIGNREDWNTRGVPRLWLYNLHYFDFLRREGIAGEYWITRWINENPQGYGVGWEPYPLSLRIVNWIKYAWSGHPLPEGASDSLAAQLRFLSGSLEYHLLANHLLANAKALIFGGSYFGGEEGACWQETGWQIYRQQLPEQILADGGHFERSLMYHSIILEDLLDVYQITKAEFLVVYIRKMLTFLKVFTGPDGKIALFNDAAFNIAPAPSELTAYAAFLRLDGNPVEEQGDLFPDSGYFRSSRGDWTLFADAAPIGPDYQPGHAHADTLGFELFYRDRRIAVDSGTSTYETAFRMEERGTAAHNTLRLDGNDSSAIWAAHRVARRARITDRRYSPERFGAAHDGYRPVIHRRTWSWQGEEAMTVEDELSGTGEHSVEIFWHFHPGVRVECEAPGRVRIDQNLILTYAPGQLSGELADSRWNPEFGLSLPNRKLILRYRGSLPFHTQVTIAVEK